LTKTYKVFKPYR